MSERSAIGVDVRHLFMGMGTGGAHVLHHGLNALRQFDAKRTDVGFHDGWGRCGKRSGLASLASFGADILSKNTWLPLAAPFP